MRWVDDPRLDAAAERLWGPDTDDRSERIARAAWTCIAEPGDGVAGTLVTALGAGPALALIGRTDSRAAADRWADVGLDDSTRDAACARWRGRLDPARCADALERAHRYGLTLVCPIDELWPSSLQDLGPHAPMALWARGDVAEALRAPTVAIVGARAATSYGESVTADLAAAAVVAGLCVVSGAAYGIDGAAHRSALGSQGRTIALLAGGADRVYPAGHAQLLGRIAHHGSVISEVAPGTVPTKWRFLQRNRLIAALARATIVVEAGLRSGSLNTAGHAAAIGRPLGAVPGPITSATSAGCHRLIREFGAQCVTGIDDVLELLGRSASDARPESTSDPLQVRVRDALARGHPRQVAEIAVRAGVTEAEARAALGALEISGGARVYAGEWTP